MGEILVGTCSWTDRALIGSGWYPPGRRDAEGRLRHYSAQFPIVEVDSAYYAIPDARTCRAWAERTPPGFLFDVKAFSLLTGHPTRDNVMPDGLRPEPRDPKVLDAVWERFTEGIEPLRAAGRLGSVLLQLPPWFRPGRRAGEFLQECAERTAGWPVSVEFRHPGWWRSTWADATRALLTRYGMAAVAVDMTQTLPTSIPPVTPVTTPRLSVVRFHGRNAAWGKGSKEDRFRHDYAEDELADWLPRLRTLAGQVNQVHVLFNNCCGDAAVRAAEHMRRLLAATGPTSADVRSADEQQPTRPTGEP
ncbi:DUF72 domain-containing protein [Streptomyces spinosirectus]|jgi:uncharacterized protein YecE (DUF72 family)|uniref:DUF72 domain-containing protein n=1 Tax=Streptomyces TaxID=1883 RepID=UPI000D3A93DD|nr:MULTISPECIES: DUF72 domain-containing protein [Streptomyces]MBY8344711.1 DUF72 domain-containing protein [Streptomyces plumbidurans]PTM94909.1 uncharacterized protein YecE (DUF72 family) [Streptomyces sp. VMFN-G11Ma]UIR17180.1 DUF72 domain-containing protein [Streptomyces spinosirectus]